MTNERKLRSAAVKQRISDSMLLNWHQAPNRRLAVSEKLKVQPFMTPIMLLLSMLMKLPVSDCIFGERLSAQAC